MANEIASNGWQSSLWIKHAKIGLVYLALIGTCLFVWFQRDLLLLAFAGVLAAIFLRTITTWLERFTHLTSVFSYVGTLVILAGTIAGLGILLLPRFATELSEISVSLPRSLHQIEQQLNQKSWGQDLLGEVHSLVRDAGARAKLPQIATTISDGMVDLIVIAAVGFFAALNPRGYREGTLILVPEPKRNRLRGLVKVLREQLKWWLFGQIFAMTVLGVGCAVGLWLFGVQLPWMLGLFTGMAVFVPYVGTIAAGVPSVLMALQRGPQTAIYVLIFYTGLHVIEGYFLTPFIQRKAVRLPPILTILSQLLMWNVAGVLGVALAAPLTTAGLVLIKEAYLHVPSDREIV